MAKRPIAATFNGILVIVLGLIFSPLSLVILQAGSGSPNVGWQFDPDAHLLPAMGLVPGLASIICGYGLLRMRPWGRVLFIAIQVYLILMIVFWVGPIRWLGEWYIDIAWPPWLLVAIVVFVGAILGMSTREVREAFSRVPPSS